MPCSDWTARRAIAADAGAIASLHVNVAREVYGDLVVPECLAEFAADEASARRDIENPRHFVVVGVEDEEIVGYADGGIYAPGDGALLEIWLKADCRGTGLGPELFLTVLRELRARGCNRLVLVVAEGLSRARDFYSRKLGGVVLGPVAIALGHDPCAELPGIQYGWPDLSALESRLDDLLA